MKTIFVTGAAGFIGSAFVRSLPLYCYNVVVIDSMNYAADEDRLKDVFNKIIFLKRDISIFKDMKKLFEIYRPDIIVNFAAETHVDRSLEEAQSFISSNIVGVQNLIDLSLQHPIKRLIQVSTDEVYGEIHKGSFKEDAPLFPSNPYSSSKAAAEFLIRSAVRAFRLPAIIVRPCNNYGPWQYPEKFIPLVILKAMQDKLIPLYGNGRNIREWINVQDCVEAINLVVEKGEIGEIYNIGSTQEKENKDVAKQILKIMGKPLSLINYVNDRPGHDVRYSINSHKIRALGWKPRVSFEDGLTELIDWSQDNYQWMKGGTL